MQSMYGVFKTNTKNPLTKKEVDPAIKVFLTRLQNETDDEGCVCSWRIGSESSIVIPIMETVRRFFIRARIRYKVETEAFSQNQVWRFEADKDTLIYQIEEEVEKLLDAPVQAKSVSAS